MPRLLIGFFVIQLLIDLSQSLTLFPFIHYAMYSEPVKRPDSLAVFEILAEGLQRIGAGRLYKALESNLTNAEGTAARFPLWYKNYLSGLLGHSIKTLEVDKDLASTEHALFPR
jgi:hypothetical protein